MISSNNGDSSGGLPRESDAIQGDSASLPLFLPAPLVNITNIDMGKKGIELNIAYREANHATPGYKSIFNLTITQVSYLQSVFKHLNASIQHDISTHQWMSAEQLYKSECVNSMLSTFSTMLEYACNMEQRDIGAPLLLPNPLQQVPDAIPPDAELMVQPEKSSIDEQKEDHHLETINEEVDGESDNTEEYDDDEYEDEDVNEKEEDPVHETSPDTVAKNPKAPLLLAKPKKPIGLESKQSKSDNVDIGRKSKPVAGDIEIKVEIKKNKDSYSSICRRTSSSTRTTTRTVKQEKNASPPVPNQMELDMVDMLRKHPYTCDKFEKYGHCDGNMSFFRWINKEKRWFKSCNAIHDKDDCLQGYYCPDKEYDCQMIHPFEPMHVCRFSRDNKLRWKDATGKSTDCRKKLLCGFIHTIEERLEWFDDKAYIRRLITDLIGGYNRFKEGTSSGSYDAYPVNNDSGHW